MDTIVFEVSTEVAHKVGGIYAVLTSKAPQMKKSCKEYYTVGPYDSKSLSADFEYLSDNPFYQQFQKLREQGIKCVYGRWVNAEKANCILVDPIGLRPKLNEIKTKMWEQYKVDSLVSGGIFNDSMVWGKAVGIVLENILAMEKFKNANVVCQFHEWLSGAALLHLHSVNARAGLVFTTHATTMGRTMAEKGEDLVKEIKNGLRGGKTISDERVKAYTLQAIHSLEKACAQNADVFTTVSKVTADEAQYILGKYPDFLTLNGVAITKYPSMEELSVSHKKYVHRIKHFVLGFFSPYYGLETDKCLYFFTSGRYEYHNKGYDMLIEALGQLNERLKKEKSDRVAVVFLFIPTAIRGGNVDVLDNLSIFQSIEEEVDTNLDEIKEHIIESVCMGNLPTKTKIFDESFLYDLKQMIMRLRGKRSGNPPLCALELADQNDQIIRALLSKGLDNKEDDHVKVIYYPGYLSSADGLLNLNYNEAIMGSHLGIFASYYEPWGYTPLESAALAVPSVTTDLSGFGKFIKDYTKKDGNAIKVLERGAEGDEAATKDLVEHMYSMLNTTKKERVKRKIEAKRLSEMADWQRLIKNYLLAYELALKNSQKRVKSG